MAMRLDGNGSSIQVMRYLSDFDKITVGATANASSALSQDSIIRISTNVDCYVSFGTAPVADNTSMYLPSGSVEYFFMRKNEKVSAIQTSSAGFVWLTRVE